MFIPAKTIPSRTASRSGPLASAAPRAPDRDQDHRGEPGSKEDRPGRPKRVEKGRGERGRQLDKATAPITSPVAVARSLRLKRSSLEAGGRVDQPLADDASARALRKVAGV